jgi:hypothetical protein
VRRDRAREQGAVDAQDLVRREVEGPADAGAVPRDHDLVAGRERTPQRAAVVGLAVADGAVVRDVADPPSGGGGEEEREAEPGCSPHDHASGSTRRAKN